MPEILSIREVNCHTTQKDSESIRGHPTLHQLSANKVCRLLWFPTLIGAPELCLGQPLVI